MSEKLLTVKQAADVLGITPGAVYDLVGARKIGHLRIGTGRGSIRLRREDLDDYLESCYRPAASADMPARPKTRRKTPSLQGLSKLAHCVPSLPRGASARHAG